MCATSTYACAWCSRDVVPRMQTDAITAVILEGILGWVREDRCEVPGPVLEARPVLSTELE